MSGLLVAVYDIAEEGVSMLDCEESLIAVEPIRSLSEMEPSGVSVEVTKSCTNKDHCQSEGWYHCTNHHMHHKHHRTIPKGHEFRYIPYLL